MTEFAFKSAGELAQDIRERRISCLELLEYFLARVEKFNPQLNALIVQRTEAARARASAADAALQRGETWGPLHGLPMTVKESYDVAGLPTTWGAPALARNIAGSDAVVVARLQGAGANIFGKTNVPLMLGDFQSYNEIYGTTNNPWDLRCGPGGSSGGGSAALAAGLVALEAGSDIGGSIRNPPHFCGVYGHKPTWGIVPPRGHAPPGILAQSDLAVVAPQARSAEDLALALDIMAGPDELAAPGWRLELPRPRQRALGDYRVAVWLDDANATVDRRVGDRLQAVVEALARAGAKIDDKARPAFDAQRAFDLFRQLMLGVVTGRLPLAAFEQNLKAAKQLAPGDRSQSAATIRAATQYYRDWVAANEERQHLRMRWHEFFQRYDVLICPICTVPAFPHDHSDPGSRIQTVNGEPQPYWDQLFWAGLATLVYLPATVAPAGPTPDGLPVGVQIIGPELGDHTTIDFARLLAREIGGFRPPPGYT